MRTPGTAESLAVEALLDRLLHEHPRTEDAVNELDDAINRLVDRERRDAVAARDA